MTTYLYQHSRGEATYSTEADAFAAREANCGRGFIFRIADGVSECIG